MQPKLVGPRHYLLETSRTALSECRQDSSYALGCTLRVLDSPYSPLIIYWPRIVGRNEAEVVLLFEHLEHFSRFEDLLDREDRSH